MPSVDSLEYQVSSAKEPYYSGGNSMPSVDSLKYQVSSAKEPYYSASFLQQNPSNLGSLLMVAT